MINIIQSLFEHEKCFIASEPDLFPVECPVNTSIHTCKPVVLHNIVKKDCSFNIILFLMEL